MTGYRAMTVQLGARESGRESGREGGREEGVHGKMGCGVS